MAKPADSRPEGSRRRFLRGYLGASLGALAASIVYPVLRFLTPPEVAEATLHEVEAGPANDPELLEKGYKIVRFGAEPVILVRVDEGEYRAFSATCTHLDCIVEYQPGARRIWCNCHGGEYDLTGRNVAGPPPRPLTPFQVHVASRGAGAPAMIVVSKA
jgi:cytochrome b6-f complex iron-sulfur subunit